MNIPKEIADRLTFQRATIQEQHILPVVKIAPAHPCEYCGANALPVVDYSFCKQPYPHWRGKCQTCKRFYNPVTEKCDLLTAVDLNRIMKLKNPNPDK